MKPTRVLRRALIAAAAMTVVVVGPAAAHPFIAGGELPVDSLATMQLDLAHGCGGHDGEEAATTEVALDVPDWLRVVEVADTDGYTAETETDDAGRVTVVNWTADGDGVPAPVFDLDVVASGTPGDQLHLGVFQGCGEDGYRWVGTPDEPADDPAINVTLAEADPDAPAPPEPTPEPEPEPEPTDEQAAADEAEEPTGEPTDEPTDEPTEDATAEDEVAEDEGAATDDEAAAVTDDGGGLSPVLLGGLVVVVLAAVAVIAARRRRGDGA